ncbi:MAG TPA: hypothetical protein VIM70_02745 [Clostridium sp.]|uniref:hypothetical protein n=1 Tax=Clostridium sp. TaxID=1506 RepID=UPI002F92CD65
MKKSDLLIGLGMGIIGCKYYNSFKNKFKPGIVKVVESTISLGENTKDFFKEATETALKLNKESYRKINEDSTKEKEANTSENIDNLKKQLAEIKKQLSIL